MSEKELKELADYVFSDARLDDEFEELTKKIQEEQNLRKKIDIFQKKPKSIPDVERLKVAFESYKKYKFFSNVTRLHLIFKSNSVLFVFLLKMETSNKYDFAKSGMFLKLPRKY